MYIRMTSWIMYFMWEIWGLTQMNVKIIWKRFLTISILLLQKLSHCLMGDLTEVLSIFPRVSNLQSAHRVQPRMAVNAAQHDIVNLLKILWVFLWLHVAIYFLCGPRQLFFFQWGTQRPKGWTPPTQFDLKVWFEFYNGLRRDVINVLKLSNIF